MEEPTPVQQCEVDEVHSWIVILNSFHGSMAEAATPLRIFGMFNEVTARAIARVINMSLDTAKEDDAWALACRVDELPIGTEMHHEDTDLFENLTDV